MHLTLIISSIAIAIITHPSGWKQAGPPPSVSTINDEVRVIIDDVDTAAERTGSRINIVRIRARAANLLWLIDQSMGRLRFNRLRDWITSNIESGAELENARIEILQQLYLRDPELAEEWLRDMSGTHSNEVSLTLSDRLWGRSEKIRIKTRLVDGTIEKDPSLATRLLGETLADGYNYPAHAALLRLAQINPGAASSLNGVLLSNLEKAAANPDSQAVIAAQLLFDYFFPGNRFVSVNSNGGSIPVADQSTRRRYFAVASQILQQSLNSDSLQTLSTVDRHLLSANQAMLAARLNSVSANLPGIDLPLIEKLRSTAQSLRPSIPSELSIPEAGPEQSASGPESSILKAMSASPIENQANRTIANRAITLQTVKSMIGRRDLAEALFQTLAIEEVTTRLPLLAEIFSQILTQREAHFSRYIVGLLVRNAAEWGPSEIKSELLLSLAGKDTSLRLLDAAIESINNLPAGNERLLTGNSFHRAFFDTALLDKEAVIVKIADIRPVSFELMARLALSEALLTSKTRN